MTSVLKRLNQLQGTLTPKHQVKSFLHKLMTFESADDALAWSFSEVALTESKQGQKQVVEALKQQCPSKDALQQALWQYGRQYEFLLQLALAPFTHWEQERHRKNLEFALACQLLPKTVRQGKSPEFEQALSQCYETIQGLHHAATQIGIDYMDAMPLLFNAQLNRDTQLLKHLDKAKKFYQDGLDWEAYQLDPTELKAVVWDIDLQNTLNYADALVKSFVLESKMTVWSNEGQHQKVNDAFNSMG